MQRAESKGRHRESGRLQATDSGLGRIQPRPRLQLRLLPSRTERKQPVFKPPVATARMAALSPLNRGSRQLHVYKAPQDILMCGRLCDTWHLPARMQSGLGTETHMAPGSSMLALTPALRPYSRGPALVHVAMSVLRPHPSAQRSNKLFVKILPPSVEGTFGHTPCQVRKRALCVTEGAPRLCPMRPTSRRWGSTPSPTNT